MHLFRVKQHTLRRLFLTGTLFVCILLQSACWTENEKGKNDIVLAEESYQANEITDAVMYYQRFLRKNPDAPERWQVWSRLLDIALNIWQEKDTARAYLELMLLEFAGRDEQLGIEKSLAALYQDIGDYTRAIALWESLVKNPKAQPEEKAIAFRELGWAYLHRLEFTQAANTVQACLDLDVTPATKANCLYDKAEIHALTEALPQAEGTLRQLLEIQGATAERRMLATFMLADVLEQQGKFAEAHNLFMSIRDIFPNEKVVALRLQYLKAKGKF